VLCEAVRTFIRRVASDALASQLSHGKPQTGLRDGISMDASARQTLRLCVPVRRPHPGDAVGQQLMAF